MTVSNIPITRNYFGVKHGKGPSDRAGAHFKNFITGAVKSKKSYLVTVEDLAKYSTKYDRQILCNGHNEHCKNTKGTDKIHNLLKVIYTGDSIQRENLEQTITYKGTRKIHSVRNTGIEGLIEKHDMLCCCPHCLYGVGECLFPEYADIWTLISVVGKKKMKGVQRSAIHEWRSVCTKRIRLSENIGPNIVPKDYAITGGRSKGKKVRRQLTMDKSNTELTESHEVMSEERGDTASNEMNRIKLVTNTVSKNQSCEIKTCTSDTQFDWDGILTELKQCHTYDEIVAVVRKYKLPPLKLRRKYRQTVYDQIDLIAQKFYPVDHPANYVPIVTKGLGNCFAHALSHALFGTQNRHVEIRVRLVFEAVMNEPLHLSNQYLSLGCTESLPARPNLRPLSTTVVSRYCTYSGDDSVRGLRLTQDEMKRIYRCDVLKISKPGAYTGIWQFHQAAEFTKIPIGTVFPDRNVNKNIRLDMNRMIRPSNSAFHNKKPIYIMWSPLSETSRASNVKHFVVLLEKYRY